LTTTSSPPSSIAAQIKLLQDLKFLGRQLSVYVESTGGWSWALAWAQLGVATIHCVPWTREAELALARLRIVKALDERIMEVS
jgi:hypothetical protein